MEQPCPCGTERGFWGQDIPELTAPRGGREGTAGCRLLSRSSVRGSLWDTAPCPQTSLMWNCQSPSKPWQASRMSTMFITLLCFPSFLGAAAFFSYTIWS